MTQFAHYVVVWGIPTIMLVMSILMLKHKRRITAAFMMAVFFLMVFVNIVGMVATQ